MTTTKISTRMTMPMRVTTMPDDGWEQVPYRRRVTYYRDLNGSTIVQDFGPVREPVLTPEQIRWWPFDPVKIKPAPVRPLRLIRLDG